MSKPNSAMGRSRDFGLEGAGKGDKSRVTDQSAYAQNFDEIDWGHGKDKTAVHSYDFRTGKFVPVPEIREDRSKPNPAWVNAHPFVEHEAEWPDVMGIGTPSTPVTNDLIRE